MSKQETASNVVGETIEKLALSSQIFRSECDRLPDHPVHLYGRMMVNMYFFRKYGHRVKNHSRRIALALSNLDGERLS